MPADRPSTGISDTTIKSKSTDEYRLANFFIGATYKVSLVYLTILIVFQSELLVNRFGDALLSCTQKVEPNHVED